MHQSVLDFVKENLSTYSVKYMDVLEVGSRNVNGSVREIIMSHQPTSYVGIDMEDGPDVNIILSAEEITSYFRKQFGLIICTEMLEHAEDWRKCINEMKQALTIGGTILITTRGPGFPYHEYPGDHWRYTVQTMQQIFRDFNVTVCMQDTDPESPGVFLIAWKPDKWEKPCDLTQIDLEKPVP